MPQIKLRGSVEVSMQAGTFARSSRRTDIAAATWSPQPMRVVKQQATPRPHDLIAPTWRTTPLAEQLLDAKQTATPVTGSSEMSTQQGTLIDSVHCLGFKDGVPVTEDTGSSFQKGTRVDSNSIRAANQDAGESITESVRETEIVPENPSGYEPTLASLVFEMGEAENFSTTFTFQEYERVFKYEVHSHQRGPIRWGACDSFQIATRLDKRVCVTQEGTKRPQPPGLVIVVTPPDIKEPLVIPALRIYTVTNAASIVRVSDGADIDATAVTLSTNTGSFVWDMTAEIAGQDAIALIDTGDFSPVPVDVIINGYTWRIHVDGWSLRQSIGQQRATIRGRSPAMQLAAPYQIPKSYLETSAKTAQQLAEQELPFDWAMTWALPTWLVPANTWEYREQTLIQAIQAIVAAGGGYIASQPSGQTLQAKPFYPSKPWLWDAETEDVQLPFDFIVARGSEKRPGSNINAVYLHGTEATGVFNRVLLDGTAGDVVAPLEVNPLFTHVDATRAAGTKILAQAQPHSIEAYELPVSPDYGGLLELGQLVAVGSNSGTFTREWAGLIREIVVSARRSGRALDIKQAIKVERHG